MAKKFKVAGGTIAIWDDATDDLPFSAPLSHLSRVKFHSDFKYIALDAATPTIETNVTISGETKPYTTSHNLGAHGKTGTPFVFGSIQVGGVWQPWVGAVPVWTQLRTNSTSKKPGYSRVITLSLTIDGTNIYAFEQRWSDTSNAHPEVVVPVRVWTSAEVF